MILSLPVNLLFVEVVLPVAAQNTHEWTANVFFIANQEQSALHKKLVS